MPDDTIHLTLPEDVKLDEAIQLMREALSEFILHRDGMWYRGIEEYVAKRYHYCSEEGKKEHVVRVARRVAVARAVRTAL